MQVIYLLLLICLTIVPILLAWAKGDLILDAFARRRRIRNQLRRRRITQSLPVRTDIVEALLKAEERRDRIEERIGRSLVRFRDLPADGPEEGHRDNIFERTGQLLLLRESKFSTYLDLAWLQSETIEVLVQEAEALRQVADIQPDALRSSQTSPPHTASPAETLLNNLDAAASRRKAVDLRLRGIGPGGGEAESPTHFDTTVM